MQRKDFLKLTGMAGAGLITLPHFAFMNLSKDYTRDQLIGKENSKIIGDSYRSKMLRTTKKALKKMKSAAKKDGFDIEVVSAFRSFKRQKELFEEKHQQLKDDGVSSKEAILKIIEYSTIPGTSRHHWGTDLDLIDGQVSRPKNVLNAKHFHGAGVYAEFKTWMDAHAEEFGFYEVYTDDPNRKGFKYEPWHFTLAEESIPMLAAYQSNIDVKELLSTEEVLGRECFSDDFIERYVQENILDINPELLP